MDYQRCADLHNEIMRRGWTESERDWIKPQTWWERHAPSPELANELSPSLIEFLKRAYLKPRCFISRTPHCFFYYLGGLASAELMLEGSILDIAEKNRYVLLYTSSYWTCDDPLGLAFDLHTSTATFIPNFNEAVDICYHHWSWLPLEDILQGYLEMLDEGKVTIIPITQSDDGDIGGPVIVRPWRWHPYTPTDVQKATSGLERLVAVIETRITALSGEPAPYAHLPWHNPDAFTDNLVPSCTFAHDLLKAISDIRVRFPTLDEFLNQPPDNRDYIRIFIVETTQITQVDGPDYDVPVPTEGLITVAIPNGYYHFTNEFRLELPFRIGARGFTRQSTGEPFGVHPEDTEAFPKGSRGSLYQAGLSNDFTDYHRVQIHRDLESWAGMVERGDWEVGGDGVLGGIEKFMEADTEQHWKKYTVPHSW
ncbi:hypothetical protein BJY04DRAFT_214483 [Aspergillus karnatakaensis]|uniref:uncharacterized protein n=1 Tax=Aspergillus karnatakaensis TaxID=1810916 RepID=UPI003CCE28D4